MVRVLILLLCMAPLSGLAQEAPQAVHGALTVNAHQAKRLHELGAMFVDIRPMREWTWGHVQGALHLDLDTGFGILASQNMPRRVPLVIYCYSEICPGSAQAARMAVAWGYRQVFYFRDGYFAWQLEDFPQEKGRDDAYAALSALVR